jgi:hypothetical protein
MFQRLEGVVIEPSLKAAELLRRINNKVRLPLPLFRLMSAKRRDSNAQSAPTKGHLWTSVPSPGCANTPSVRVADLWRGIACSIWQ